ncbi:tetratricopeptide repeat 28-like [Paramuricea clavata]|uniref:Tetratricopeptide repeat 28-like n=1 Tax=Paramuricea clavata TaxID=317549 RepID=A0A6S7GKS3_PARCT|nr:tetratricopeptide repeat 28-like [Paramuricea clavata]
MATENKPALELIRTPEEMAELQDEEIDVKEGYHLADIMSRAVLLYGNQPLLDEYNVCVAKILNTNSSVKEGKSTGTVGLTRGIRMMMRDVETYEPFNSYLGEHCVVGGLFDVKKQFYRLISLLLSNLGLVFDIISSSPWQVISELQTRGIIDESESVNIKVCLSIANEIRLKTYFANNGQKELFSPVPQNANIMEQSADAPIFRDFDEDILVRLVSTSYDICNRCLEFCFEYIKQDNIDVSLFRNPSLGVSKAWLLGVLYHRLQNPGKALEYMKSVPEDSPDYQAALITQGLIYCMYEEYEKSVEYFEKARQLHDPNKCMSNLRLIKCINGLAAAHGQMGNYKMAINLFKEAIRKHSEIYGEGYEILILTCLLNLGCVYHEVGNHDLALKTFKDVEEMIMKEGLTNVLDQDMIYLNLYMAASLSELDQHVQSRKYLERALHLSHKVFGEHSSSIQLAQTYRAAGNIYCLCKQDNEAEAVLKRSLDIFLLVFGGRAHPGKIHVLVELGKFFYKKHETSIKAVEILESALEQARTLYPPEKPKIIIAVVLVHLGIALFYAKKLWESLPYFQKAKKTMDRILGPDHLHSHTSTILYNMGRNYHELRDVPKAHQCYEDALNIISEIYGENSILAATCSMAAACLHRAYAEYELGNSDLAKDYCTKAVNIYKKISLTKNSCRSDVVVCLYRLSSFCEALGKLEALKHLEEAGKIAKDAGFKECVVDILVSLIRKYAEMGCIIKSMMCYVEAGEIAKSLPAHEPLSPSTLEMLKLMKI